MIDWEEALASVNHDRALLVEVTQILLSELPELHSELRSATRTANHKAIRSAAHKFKGSVRFLGQSSVYDLTEKIELLEPMDLAQVKKWVEALGPELTSLITEINAFMSE